MTRIILINMPFASVTLPAIGLTQLKAVLDRAGHDNLAVEIHHLNHDVASYLGVQLYEQIASSVEHLTAGLGDWFFRHEGFPGIEDNREEYYQRFYPSRRGQGHELRQQIEARRLGVGLLLDDLIDRYGLAQAEIVGFTSMFSQNVASFALARKLKERNPQLVTVLGGANCEAPMGQEIVAHVAAIDFVFAGPALVNFPQFVAHYLAGELGECHRLRGVCSKLNAGLNLSGPVMGEELPIDAAIQLDYEPFLHAFERNFAAAPQIKPALQFETSRGCSWGERSHCTFCGLNGAAMSYRAMRPDLAVDYIRSFFKYADRVAKLDCVDNILPKKYLTDVFPQLQPPEQVNIFYEVKADLTDQECATLARARVLTIQPGIEALATSTLKLMRKGTSAFQNVRLLKNCVTYGIYPLWNLLVGFPGEDAAVYRKYIHDLPLLTHLPPPSGVHPVRFDRFSPYFDQADHYGLDLTPLDFYEFVYPFGPSTLSKMAYYFYDRNFEADYFITLVDWLEKMREAFAPWPALWSPDAATIFPKLYLKQTGSGFGIYDSRRGQAREYPIPPTAAELLRHLDRPRKIAQIGDELGHIPSSAIQQDLALLREHGLLFEEDDRVLSLVLPSETRVLRRI